MYAPNINSTMQYIIEIQHKVRHYVARQTVYCCVCGGGGCVDVVVRSLVFKEIIARRRDRKVYCNEPHTHEIRMR